MSLKAELETWAAALNAYDDEDFEKSLELFSRIADNSKIQTNMGLIYATLGEHEVAVERFNEATNLDQYLAVAYFQCGVSNFLLNRYEMALRDFEEAYLYLRGNQHINYEQLGLNFRLYSAEVLFNQGLAKVYLSLVQEGLEDMENARLAKATDEHNVIDEAIQDRGEGYTIFSIPVGVLYRPSEKKIKNSVTKDYLGKAKLVAASDPGDAFIEFSGVTRLKQGISPSGVYIDRPIIDTGRSTNLNRSTTTSAHTEAPKSALERSKSTLNPVRGLNVKRSGSSPLSPSGQISMAPTGRNYQPARSNPNSISRLDSQSASVNNYAPLSPSNYAPSYFGGGPTVRRKSTRRTTRANTIQSRYEEEEGYASGDYDDSFLEIIRVKIHYEDDVRGMTLQPNSAFEDFLGKVAAKFNKNMESIRLKFMDEDGVKVTLKDESDYELAVETARSTAKGKAEGKLEIWCTT